MNRVVWLLPALVFACSRLPSTLFAEVMDSNYTPASAPSSNGFSFTGMAKTFSLAQTFTVTQDGLLSRVDLLAGGAIPPIGPPFGPPNAPLTLDIRTLAGAAPTEPNSGLNILGSFTMPATNLSTIPQWTTFTFAPIPVTAGEQLALALTTASTNYFYFWTGDSNSHGFPAGTYGGGQAFDRGVDAQRAPGDPTPSSQWGNPYFADGGGALVDFGFRTFLTPVPEPSTTAIFLLGAFAHLALCGKLAQKPRRIEQDQTEGTEKRK